MGKLRVKIDRESCIGCGYAPSVCSEVFIMVDGKNAIVEKFRLNNDLSEGIVPEDYKNCVKTAADNCPVSAITVIEEE